MILSNNIHIQIANVDTVDSRDVQSRYFSAWFGFEKKLDSVWNEYGSVWFDL